MSLAECIASVGLGSGKVRYVEDKCCEDAIHDKLQEQYYADKSLCNDKEELLDVLRYVIESSKQHFNPGYRLRGDKSDYSHILVNNIFAVSVFL